MAPVETITIQPDQLVKETPKAGLFRFDGKSLWCPWSQVDWNHQENTLTLPVWLYEKENELPQTSNADLTINVVSLYKLIMTCDPRIHRMNGKKDREHCIGILKTIRNLLSIDDDRSLYIRRHIADVISSLNERSNDAPE